MCDYARACQNVLAGLRAQHAVIAAPQQPLRARLSVTARTGAGSLAGLKSVQGLRGSSPHEEAECHRRPARFHLEEERSRCLDERKETHLFDVAVCPSV